jgi:type IV pilus assembly protein PilZ
MSEAIQRPHVFSVTLKTKAALYSSYLPFIKGGALFLPSVKEHKIGEEVIVLLSFLDEPQRVPIASTVVWVNPPHAAGNRPQGIAVKLPDTDGGKQLRGKIDQLLAGTQASGKSTHTL